VLVWAGFIGLQPGVDDLVAGAVMMTLYFAYAAMMVAHLGWAGELDPTYHGRTRVLGAVQAASLAGQIIILAAAAASQLLWGGGPAGAVHAMGWTLICMLALTTITTILWVPERRLPPQPHLGFVEAIRTLAGNRMVRRVLLPDLLLGVAQGVSGGLFMDFCRHALGFQRESEALLFVYFIASFAGVPFWVWLGRRLGKHVALQYAFIYAACTTAGVLLVPPGDLAFACIMIGVAGLSQGAGVLLTRSLMADVVDDDELRTGARRSGMFFGVLLTTSKIGLATGPLTYFALGWVEFDGALGAANSPLAMQTLAGLFIFVPMALYLLAALSLRKYPLDEKRQAEIAAAITARATPET
jgi:Na+/melibiose symporter-like transporter